MQKAALPACGDSGSPRHCAAERGFYLSRAKGINGKRGTRLLKRTGCRGRRRAGDSVGILLCCAFPHIGLSQESINHTHKSHQRAASLGLAPPPFHQRANRKSGVGGEALGATGGSEFCPLLLLVCWWKCKRRKERGKKWVIWVV